MRVINGKGRLFSKINVIDFLVVLFLLCLVPAFYFGYKILTKKPEVVAPKKEFVEIETNCQLVKLNTDLLKHISVGDKELDEKGQVIGEIISLGQSGPYKYEFDIGGQKIIKEDPILKQIEAKLKLKAEVKEDKPYYKDDVIKIGSPLEFKTDKYTLMTVPFKKEEKEKEFIETEFDYRFIKVKPEFVKIISIGDKELNEKGQVIGEIISLGQSGPYKYEIDLGENQKLIKEDPILKQIDAKIKLKTEIKQGEPYYKDMVIRIGSSLEFKTDKYTLMTIPIEEEEEEKEIKERTIDLIVSLKDLNENQIKEISVGDKEIDERGETIAEIINLGILENSSLEFDLGGGNFVKDESKTRKQILTRMRLKCQVGDGNQLYYKGKKIEYKTPLEFMIKKYKIIGLPSEAYPEKKWISLRVKFFGVLPELANIIQKGDMVKSAFGEVEARIQSVISNKPALVTTIELGEFLTLEHPFNRDIMAAIDVLCEEKEGAHYFKEYLAKIGNNIVFNTDLYSISGLIVGIEIK